jgi:hypothetical protein
MEPAQGTGPGKTEPRGRPEGDRVYQVGFFHSSGAVPGNSPTG